MILEEVTGQKIDDLIQKLVFDPRDLLGGIGKDLFIPADNAKAAKWSWGTHNISTKSILPRCLSEYGHPYPASELRRRLFCAVTRK